VSAGNIKRVASAVGEGIHSSFLRASGAAGVRTSHIQILAVIQIRHDDVTDLRGFSGRDSPRTLRATSSGHMRPGTFQFSRGPTPRIRLLPGTLRCAVLTAEGAAGRGRFVALPPRRPRKTSTASPSGPSSIRCGKYLVTPFFGSGSERNRVFAVRNGEVRRRLHHQPSTRRRDGGKAWVAFMYNGAPLTAGARRPAAAGAASLFLEERKVGS